jgi:hypothetical protein
MGCGVGFDSISAGVWLTMGCGVGCRVAHGGFVGWLAVVVSIFYQFQWFWVWVFLCFCFTLFQTHNVKYLLEHFPRMQTNTEKKKILFSLKSFTFKNILHCKIFYNETNEA